MRHTVVFAAVLLASVVWVTLGAVPVAEEAEAVWQNLTVYRITPITDKGVTNMNTADAAGDVYFGLSQLLLPYMCTGASASMCMPSGRRHAQLPTF